MPGRRLRGQTKYLAHIDDVGWFNGQELQVCGGVAGGGMSALAEGLNKKIGEAFGIPDCIRERDTHG